MYLKEALQIWYCLFYKLLNAQNFKILNLSLVKKYMIIKIEKIIILNGNYAVQIFQYPRKFISVLRYADKIIHQRSIYFKNLVNEKQKSLILFDHLANKFFKNFRHKLVSIGSLVTGRLIFIQGKVVKKGKIYIKKFERTLLKDQGFFLNSNEACIFDQKKIFPPQKTSLGDKCNNSRIEFQNIRIIKLGKDFHIKNDLELTLIDISLVGKMTTLCKTGQIITVWGIVKQTNEIFQGNKKNSGFNLSIDAVSLFIEKEKNFFKPNNGKISYSTLSFLLFSQDSKIKGEQAIFIKKILSIFLAKKFSEIFKIMILFSFLGGCIKKNLTKTVRNSINICFVQNYFDIQLNLFNQIRKFFKNTVYLSTHPTCKSEFSLNGQPLNLFRGEKKIIKQFLNHPLCLFIDFIDFSDQKKTNLLYSLIYKKASTMIFKKNKIRIVKPFTIFTTLNLPDCSSIKPTESKILKIKSKKIFSFFDIVISPQNFIQFPNNFLAPYFFTTQNSNLIVQSVEKPIRKNQFRHVSYLNLSKYLIFLKSFRNPKFSSGAEKLLILWYLSNTSRTFMSNIGIFFLEKLVKFSQASTKLWDRDNVLIQDTIFAISVLENLYFCNCLNKKNCFCKMSMLKKSNFRPIINFLSKNQKIYDLFISKDYTNACSSNLFL